MKYLNILIFSALSLASYNAMADYLLTKNSVSSAIYRVNIITPDNKPAVVDVKASFGKMSGANCRYTKLINVGELSIENNKANNVGTAYGISNEKLKQHVGNGYTCGKLTFNYNETQEKEFKLAWDGNNYFDAMPVNESIIIQ